MGAGHTHLFKPAEIRGECKNYPEPSGRKSAVDLTTSQNRLPAPTTDQFENQITGFHIQTDSVGNASARLCHPRRGMKRHGIHRSPDETNRILLFSWRCRLRYILRRPILADSSPPNVPCGIQILLCLQLLTNNLLCQSTSSEIISQVSNNSPSITTINLRFGECHSASRPPAYCACIILLYPSGFSVFIRQCGNVILKNVARGIIAIKRSLKDIMKAPSKVTKWEENAPLRMIFQTKLLKSDWVAHRKISRERYLSSVYNS